jgi:hypothetical protein
MLPLAARMTSVATLRRPSASTVTPPSVRSYDAALHFAHPSHERKAAVRAAEADDLLAESARKLRAAVETGVELSGKDVAAAKAAVDQLAAHLTAATKELHAQQACMATLRATAQRLRSASDRETVDICAKAIADGTLQLSKRMPEGLLRELTSEQRQHFMRLLPDVEPVSQRSAALLASRIG